MIKFLLNSFLSLTLITYITFSPFVIVCHEHDNCNHDTDHDFKVCFICLDVHYRKNIQQSQDIKLILNESSNFLTATFEQTLYFSHKSLVALNIKLTE